MSWPPDLATEDSFRAAQSDREAQHVYDREVLTFRLGRELYGVDIGWMREIVTMRPITMVPRTPRFVTGLITVRGIVVPILDLRLRLGLSAAPTTEEARILVLEEGGEPIGLVVDEVHKVVRLRDGEVEPVTPGAAVASEMIGGIARWHGDLLLLLDVPVVVRFPIGEVR